MQGRHLVALGDVVGVPRDENDLNGIVALADLLCHGDAVHCAHFDVQEQDIVAAFLRTAEQEGLGGGKGVDMHRVPPGGGPAGGHAGNVGSVLAGIVADGDFVGHAFTVLSVLYGSAPILL